MQLKINISGGGTKMEIIQALQILIDDIRYAEPDTLASGIEWEDETLMTEITEAAENEVAEWFS